MARGLSLLPLTVLVFMMLSSSMRMPGSEASHVGTPVIRENWVVNWEVTQTDGIRIFDVTYKGTLVLRDARIPGVIVQYFDSGCYFYDEFYANWILHQNIFVEDTSQGVLEPSDSGFQIRGNYDVPGYDYQQIWRFLPDGRFLVLMYVGGGGCFARHIYEARWRLDFAMVDDPRDSVHSYSGGAWLPIRTERELVDDGDRDASRTYTKWRVTGAQRSYYFVPFDTPEPTAVPTVVLAVANHPNEVESSHIPGQVTPYEYVNEERTWRQDIAVWLISKHMHDPATEMLFSEPILTGAIFYPSGF